MTRAPTVGARCAAAAALVMWMGFSGCGGSRDRPNATESSAKTTRSGDAPSAAVAPQGAEGPSVLDGEPKACVPSEALANPAAADAEALLPPGIVLPDGLRYLSVAQNPTYVTITAELDDTTPGSLRKRYSAEVRGAGYDVIREDDEGFEAEVFFLLTDGNAATLQFVKNACPPDTVRMLVSYIRTPPP